MSGEQIIKKTDRGSYNERGREIEGQNERDKAH